MLVNFDQETLDIKNAVVAFMKEHVYPRNRRYIDNEISDRRNDPETLAFVQELRMKAKNLGLWNFFFPHLRAAGPGNGMSNLNFATFFEEMGKLRWAPEVFKRCA